MHEYYIGWKFVNSMCLFLPHVCRFFGKSKVVFMWISWIVSKDTWQKRKMKPISMRRSTHVFEIILFVALWWIPDYPDSHLARQHLKSTWMKRCENRSVCKEKLNTETLRHLQKKYEIFFKRNSVHRSWQINWFHSFPFLVWMAASCSVHVFPCLCCLRSGGLPRLTSPQKSPIWLWKIPEVALSPFFSGFFAFWYLPIACLWSCDLTFGLLVIPSFSV